MSLRPTNRETAGLIAGFALWSLCFLLLYGAHGTICATGEMSAGGARILLVGLWAAMIAATAALALWLFRRLGAAPKALRFARLVSFVLAVVALGATVWTGLPVLLLRIC